MIVRHNPNFNPKNGRFENEGDKDFRWWFNRIFPAITGKGWVDVRSIKVNGVTVEEIENAIRDGARLGMWFYLFE